YYFAIKTLDEVPNISYMSNIATAATPLQDKFSCTACTAVIVRSTLNRVAAQDNALLSSCFGKDPATTLPGGRSCTPADINKDGSVNQADVDCLRSVYFQTCTASP
ncbi:hypothetical protein HYU94_01150, partial [Candidatus Daviesbacteria bacterium]|nr:hypothetical protein [Candidatus Daviesbacteria bacterium]